MKVFISQFKSIVSIFLVMLLVGCVQTKSVPGYARAGDVIVLGMGGVHRNAVSEPVIAVDDLTITITDNNNITHNLQGLTTFKSYSDYSSSINTTALLGNSAGLGIVPFDGGWFVTVPLTAVGDLNTPLPLAVGPATISITSPKLVNTATIAEGDLTAIPIEIIAGTAAFDEGYNDQFEYYVQSANSFIIRPNDLTGIDMVGGAYFVIDYTDDTIFNSGNLPMVMPSNHNPYVQLSYNVKPNGDGSGKIYVTLLNPAGFTTFESTTTKSALLADLSVKLLYSVKNGVDLNTYKSSFSVDLANSYYINTNGDLIAGMTPSMVHIADL